MNKILMEYAQRDASRIQLLIDQLSKLGISAVSLSSSIKTGESFLAQISSMISEAKVIVFFISKNSVTNEALVQEITLAYESAKTRDKQIILIVEWKDLTLPGTPLEFLLKSQQIIYPEDGLHSEQDYRDVAGKIYDICSTSEGKELLYEKITNLSRIHYTRGVSSNLSNLILLLCHEAEQESNASFRRNTYKELSRCVERLQSCGESDYTSDDRDLAHKRLDALAAVNKLLSSRDFHTLDLFLISFALKMIGLDYHIRLDVIDTLTGGDIHSFEAEKLQEYLSRQDFYLQLYNHQIVAENITNANHGKYPEDEIPFILEAKKYLIRDGVGRPAPKRPDPARIESADTENQLHAIADYIRQSNRLFELAGSNSLASDFLKCLKTSYERLRNYSEVVGCLKVSAECIERIAEINQQLEQFINPDSDNSIAESGLKALLGFNLPGSDHFDVFLSYNHKDHDLVESLYHFLKSNLLNPFFDKFSLSELSDSDYESSIMNAIDHSKHFIVVLSDLDYLNSPWVNLEMKTFHHEMIDGRKPDANFLLIVTNDVFRKLISTNKQCLPIQYRSYEILCVDDYKSSIVQYLR